MKKLFLLNLLLVIILTACNLPATSPTQGKPADKTLPVVPTGSGVTDTESAPTSVVPTEIVPTITETIPAPVIPPLTVAYVKAGDVYLWVEGVGSTRLTTVGDVSRVRLSDDGTRVAFAKFVAPGATWGQEELWAVNADGSNLRLLAGVAELNAIIPGESGTPRDFVFIPNSHVLAYATGYIFEGPGNPFNKDLRNVDVDSMITSVILDVGSAGSGFVYSPDASLIVLQEPEELFVVNADGSSRRSVLTFLLVYTYSEWFYLPGIVWSADSTEFTVAIPSHDPLGNPAEISRVYRVTTAGTSTLLMEYTAAPVFICFPEVSPDATRLLYCGDWMSDAPTTTVTIRDAALDLSSNTAVVTGNLETAGWAPDSQYFAYWERTADTFQYGTTGSLFNMLPGGVVPLPSFRWVVDNRYLYINKPPAASELRVGDTSGGSVLIDSGAALTIGDFDAIP